MSDFRFKISGITEPYVAQIYRTSDNSLICSKLAENSGIEMSDVCDYSCVIFDGLVENTNYCVKITDCIGNEAYSGTYQTPENPVVLPTEVTVSMLGTVIKAAECVCSLDPNQSKCISVTPQLIDDQSINLTFSGITSVSSDDEANITVWCKPSGQTTFTEVVKINGNNSFSQAVTISAGDVVCYDENSIINHNLAAEETSNSSASLKLVGITNDNGVDIINTGTTELSMSQTCVTTTTTTTTASQTTTTTTTIGGDINSVYFDLINTDIIPSDQLMILCYGLATESPMNSGDSFDLYLTQQSEINYSVKVNDLGGVIVGAKVTNNGDSNVVYNNSISVAGGEEINLSCYDYNTSNKILIESNNISDYLFCVYLSGSTFGSELLNNSTSDFNANTYLFINTIAEPSGDNYDINVLESEFFPYEILVDSNNIQQPEDPEQPVA